MKTGTPNARHTCIRCGSRRFEKVMRFVKASGKRGSTWECENCDTNNKQSLIMNGVAYSFFYFDDFYDNEILGQ